VLPPLRILVVDDDEYIRDALAWGLSDAGYDVEAAADGVAAMAMARARPPDLLLLDMMMPGMDGDQVIEAVRATNRLSTTPVVLITASAVVPSDSTIGFLRKPVPLEVILRVVATFAADAAEGVRLGMALRRDCTVCPARAGQWCVSRRSELAEHMHIERFTGLAASG
jgi:CheY-like chemotaxis protein